VQVLQITLKLPSSPTPERARKLIGQYALGNITMNFLARIFMLVGSTASIGFGVWHFFVPNAWHWYAYIDAKATELVVAVRAINTLFSLSLVLFGLMNILSIYVANANRYSIIILLGANCILWLTRLVLQVINPQGAIQPLLQYGMLSAFIVINLCYLFSLGMVVVQKPGY
jgi:hypothetical protein